MFEIFTRLFIYKYKGLKTSITVIVMTEKNKSF